MHHNASLEAAAVDVDLPDGACPDTWYANLIGNGSFETPVIDSDFQVFGTNASIGNWTVQFTDVDIVRNNILGTGIVAQEGSQWLDLNGYDRGGVFQFITTVAGADYNLRFWYSDNPFSNAQGSQLGVAKTGSWSNSGRRHECASASAGELHAQHGDGCRC